MSSEYQTGREGEFTYRGHTLNELREMTVDEVAELLPARQRRTIERGLGEEHEKLLEAAREADPEELLVLLAEAPLDGSPLACG